MSDPQFESLFQRICDKAWLDATARWEAIKRGRTHCVNGHPWIETNIRVYQKKRNGRKYPACRLCEKEATRRRRQVV